MRIKKEKKNILLFFKNGGRKGKFKKRGLSRALVNENSKLKSMALQQLM